jgi:hypothetical protein
LITLTGYAEQHETPRVVISGEDLLHIMVLLGAHALATENEESIRVLDSLVWHVRPQVLSKTEMLHV